MACVVMILTFHYVVGLSFPSLAVVRQLQFEVLRVFRLVSEVDCVLQIARF